MIELTQHGVDQKELMSPFNKLGELTININVELIKNDINRLKVELNSTKNKINKVNINALISHLNKLLKYVDEDGHLELCWDTSGKKSETPYTYPISIVNEPLYKVSTANYIELEDGEKLIEVNLSEIADMLAFEFMFKDLGETHDSIEELLNGCGIAGLVSNAVLINYFKETGDDLFRLSKSMKIDECPYASAETKKVTDYFHTKEFKASEYRDVIDYSCRYASTIIASDILREAAHFKKEVKLLEVDALTIAFIIKADDEFDINKLIDQVSLRVFGRKFLVNTKISTL